MNRYWLFFMLLLGCESASNLEPDFRRLRIDFVSQPEWYAECSYGDSLHLSLRTHDDTICEVSLINYKPILWNRLFLPNGEMNDHEADTMAIGFNTAYVSKYSNGVHYSDLDSIPFTKKSWKDENSITLLYVFKEWMYEIQYFKDGWSLSYLMQGHNDELLEQAKAGVRLRDVRPCNCE